MKIDHIGIATNGIDEAAKWWREALGVDFGETEEVAEQKVRVAKLPLGESCIELLEPASANGHGRLPCGLCSSIIDRRRAARTGTEDVV